jgi:enoyl-CoA hydratase/3-hydroxyacyl-CoA dehydrogenase
MLMVCVQGGLARIKSNLASRVKKGKMSQAAADAALSKVKGTLDYADFSKWPRPAHSMVAHQS